MSMKSKWTKKSDACSAMLNLKRRKLKILTWLWCTKNKISATAANALFVKFVSLRSLCCKNILQQRTKINGKNNTNSFYVICLQNCVNAGAPYVVRPARPRSYLDFEK